MAIPRADSYSAASGATVYGGRFILPAWIPALNTIASAPEVNSFASIDPGDSPPNGWSYNVGGTLLSNHWNTVIDDFSGGVYNPYLGLKGSMIYNGGGHSATNWGGIVRFDIATLTYSIVVGGTLNAYPIDETNQEYADGNPASAHTYDVLAIVGPEAGYSQGALVTPFLAAATIEGNSSNSVHLFDFAHPELGWVRKASHAAGYSLYVTVVSAYDADLGRIWWMGSANEVGYQPYFDIATNTQNKVYLSGALSPPYFAPDAACMRYDSARKILILVYVASGVRHIAYFNTQSPASGWTIATLSTPFPTPTNIGFAFDKVPDGNYLCYNAQTPGVLNRITVPSVLTDAWQIGTLSYSGTALDAGYVLGKRWSYVPSLLSFICKISASSAHKVIRI